MSFSITLPIRATGKGRPRHGKGFTYTPKATVNAEAEIKWLLRAAKPPLLTSAVWLTIEVSIKKPKSSKNKHPVVKPDIDNITKLICDAGNGILWDDDKQICFLTIAKNYGHSDYVTLNVRDINGV